MGEGTAVKGVVVLNYDANDWKGWERWGVGGRGYCGDGGVVVWVGRAPWPPVALTRDPLLISPWEGEG